MWVGIVPGCQVDLLGLPSCNFGAGNGRRSLTRFRFATARSSDVPRRGRGRVSDNQVLDVHQEHAEEAAIICGLASVGSQRVFGTGQRAIRPRRRCRARTQDQRARTSRSHRSRGLQTDYAAAWLIPHQHAQQAWHEWRRDASRRTVKEPDCGERTQRRSEQW